MDDLIKKIRTYLDEQERIRDEVLEVSHAAIRRSSSAMAALHRGEREEVSEELESVEKRISRLNGILDSYPNFSDHGALIAAHREYSEVILTRALIDGEDLPGPDEIDVHYKGYAQALAEAIGELRRHLLDLLREDEVEEAQHVHRRMERVFDRLEQFDYPNSILPGMRERRDGARKSLEMTRADVTRAVREERLEDALSETRRELRD